MRVLALSANELALIRLTGLFTHLAEIMNNAVIGIVGMIIGFLLTSIKDWLKE